MLIVDGPWAQLIVQGKKTWEIRSQTTMIRERIGIALKGTHLLIGEASVIDSFELSDEMIRDNFEKHRVEHVEEYVGDGPAYAWVMSNAREYTQAKEYVRPQGAIKWVHVPPATVSCRIFFSSKSVPNIFSKFPR